MGERPLPRGEPDSISGSTTMSKRAETRREERQIAKVLTSRLVGERLSRQVRKAASEEWIKRNPGISPLEEPEDDG